MSSGNCACFLGAIGREDLTDDPRFATPDARKQHARELVIILDEVFSRRDLAEWRTILDGVGVTFGIVATVNEALDDPQMRAYRRAGAVRRRPGAYGDDAVPYRRRGQNPGGAGAFGRPAQ